MLIVILESEFWKFLLKLMLHDAKFFESFGWPLIKIISARNQDIIMVYEAVIKIDIYGVGLANTRAQL
jgi:hypothetical protein